MLAAGVADEVNTPLRGVSSYTQMLLNMLPETDPKHALLLKVHRQADRATEIVNNLLNFSRTGSAAEFKASIFIACSMTRCNCSSHSYVAAKSKSFANTQTICRKFTETQSSSSRSLP